jgi:hypothetical protein
MAPLDRSVNLENTALLEPLSWSTAQLEATSLDMETLIKTVRLAHQGTHVL